MDEMNTEDEIEKRRKYFREYMRAYSKTEKAKEYKRKYYINNCEYFKNRNDMNKKEYSQYKKEMKEYEDILKEIDLTVMSTLYCTINLAKYILQPWKGLPKLYQLMQLIPNDETHMCFTVNKLLKEYFSGDVKGNKFIAYKDGQDYWVDLFDTDEELDSIKKKPCMKMYVKDGKIKISM